MTSQVTVLVQNMAALCNVTDAIPAILNSACTWTNVHNTIFLLRPYSSDHLGTIHKIDIIGNPHSTLIIVMPEVLITSDDALMRLPNVFLSGETHQVEYCPVRVEYGWGSGKAEVNAFLEQQHSLTPQDESESGGETKSTTTTTTTTTTTIIPATKGLCCVMYEDISSKTHSQGAFRLPPILSQPTQRTVPWKNNPTIVCEHLFTEHFIVKVADLSNGQTHVGAVYFDVGANLMLVGCHLTFQGNNHPDLKGAIVRKNQIKAIQEHIKIVLAGSNSEERALHRCCIAGDLNVRPTATSSSSSSSSSDREERLVVGQPSPTIEECRSTVDSVLSMIIPPESTSSSTSNTTYRDTTLFSAAGRTVTSVETTTTTQISPSWATTLEWQTTPFCTKRKFPLHPPTYPIQNHALWENFLSRSDQEIHGGPVGTIFESPTTLCQEHYYIHGGFDHEYKYEDIFCDDCGELGWSEQRCEAHCRDNKDATSLYDTYKKKRFTPSSWTDGMIVLDSKDLW